LAHENWSVTDPGLENNDERLALVAGGTQRVAGTLAAKLARRRAEREAARQPIPWWHDEDPGPDNVLWSPREPEDVEPEDLEPADHEELDQNDQLDHDDDAALGHDDDAALGHDDDAALGHDDDAALGHDDDAAPDHDDDAALGHDGHLARADAYERWARGLEESNPEPAVRQTPSVATRGRHGRRRPKPQRRSARPVVAVTAVAGALVLALLLAFLRPGGDAPAPGRPTVARAATDSVVAFVMDEVDRGASVVADPSTVSALVRAGFPAESLSTYANPASEPSVIVVTSALRADRGSAAAALLSRSVPLVQFGASLEIRQVLPTGMDSSAVLADRESRRSAGAALVTDNRLRLTPDAWAALTDGSADARVLSALSILVAKHLLDVASIGGAGSTGAGPARSVEITAVDGVPVSADSPGLKDAVASLRAQPAPYRPQRTEVVRIGGVPTLLIHFLAPSPLALPNA
jgi:hypothetical protein